MSSRLIELCLLVGQIFWHVCGKQLNYIAKGDLLEVAWVKLAQKFLCHLISHSDLHVTEEIAELLFIDDAVLVLVLILEQSQESIEE